MLLKTTILFAVLTTMMTFTIQGISGHGQLFDPPSRSSLWRFPEFSQEKLTSTHNNDHHNDLEQWCGGIDVQYRQNGGKCGVCGDPWNQPEPRDNEDGGRFGSGIIVRNYTAGQVAHVKLYMLYAHWGYFEIRLCERDDLSTPLTQQCLDKNVLKMTTAPGVGRKYPINNNDTNFYIQTQVYLPKRLKCKKCVLQWHYQAEKTWGYCANGTIAAGCENQIIFRGCADVAIN